MESTDTALTQENVPCKACEEETFDEKLARLDEVMQIYRQQPGSLIQALHLAQGIFGYLPREVQEHVARRLRVPISEVYGVVSFYSFFTDVPRGKHTIRVCLGTSCYVRGGRRILESLDKNLGLQVGQTTDDRQFTLELMRCAGACGLSPIVMVDDDLYHRVKPNQVSDVLKRYGS